VYFGNVIIIDHLYLAEDKPLDQKTRAPDLPLQTQSDFIPVSDTVHSEQLPNVEQRADQPPTERHYLRRLKCQPLTRYSSYVLQIITLCYCIRRNS